VPSAGKSGSLKTVYYYDMRPMMPPAMVHRIASSEAPKTSLPKALAAKARSPGRPVLAGGLVSSENGEPVQDSPRDTAKRLNKDHVRPELQLLKRFHRLMVTAMAEAMDCQRLFATRSCAMASKLVSGNALPLVQIRV
jgi:hypothetical protein